MIFAEVKGFCKLIDEQVPDVLEEVLGAFASVLERYDDAIEHRNTWGDALYVVLTDTVQTAECALELQSAIASIDLQALGLTDHLALRIAPTSGRCSRSTSRCSGRARSPVRTSAAPRGSSL